jgi:hypothetical protein
MKVPVIVTDDYIIYLEHFDSIFWLHTDVFKWSNNIKRKFVSNLNKTQSLLNEDLYALVDNDKLGKFANNINFKFLQEITGKDSNQYRVFIRRLEWVD